MSARAARAGACGVALIVALTAVAPRPARAGEPSVDWRRAFVFSDGAVNLVVLPYEYHSSDPARRGSEAADQIPLLLQANGLLQMLRYGAVGSINLVNPGRDPGCTPEAVLEMLTREPFQQGRLRKGHGLILVWGTLYEEAGEFQMQTFMRVLRGASDETLTVALPEGRSMTVSPSATTLAFAPQYLTGEDLQGIAERFRKAVEVRTGPSPTAPLAPFEYYDARGRGLAYTVVREKDGWLQVRSMEHGPASTGWIRANLVQDTSALAARMPEIEFIGLAAGYLRARVAAGRPGDRAPARTLDWVRASLDRYLAAAGPDGDPTTAAVGRQLVALTACLQAASAAPQAGLADTLAARAAEVLPNDAAAQRLAGALMLRADAGRNAAAERSALVERRLARAAVITGGDTASLGALQTLYAISAAPGGAGGTARRLAPDVASRRLATLRERPKVVPSHGIPEPNLATPGHYVAPIPGLETGNAVPLERVRFRPDGAVLIPEAKRYLDTLCVMFDRCPELLLQVEAHMDTRTPASRSQALSERRAKAVRAYLLEHSRLRPEQVRAIGFGGTHPRVAEHTEADRLANQRVELRVLNLDAIHCLDPP